MLNKFIEKSYLITGNKSKLETLLILWIFFACRFIEDVITAILEQQVPDSVTGICLAACIKKETGLVSKYSV